MFASMFGPRLTTVFASRWRALWFAGMTLLTAYCSIPSAEESEQAGAAAAPHEHVNPWAKD